MKRTIYHIMIPAILPVIFFVIASMPVQTLGCRTRGLVALAIAFVSGFAALTTAMKAARRRAKDARNSFWWLSSTLILVVPVIGILILA